MSDDPKQFQEWLRRLKWALGGMPSPECDDIYDETRSHLRELLAMGKSPEEALEGFGRPEDYARRFLDEMEVVKALGAQRTGTMLSVISRRLHRSAVAAAAMAVLLPIAAVALTAASILIFKLGDPARTGLWRSAHVFFIGKIEDPATAHDLLGYWMYPLTLVVIAAAWLIGRLVLLWALKTIARPR